MKYRIVILSILAIWLSFPAQGAETPKDQLKIIRNLVPTVLYPTFVPVGFSLVSVSTSSDLEDGKEYFDYALKFCGPKKLCFEIASASIGIGGSVGNDRELSGSSKIFGHFTIDVRNPNTELNGSGETFYISDWLDDEKMKAAKKSNLRISDGRHHQFLGNGVTDEEAVKIVESLNYMK